MSQASKFLFDHDFEAPPPPPPAPVVLEEEGPPPPPPPPTFSEEELAAARAQAHAQGFSEGIGKGKTDTLTGQEHLLNQLLTNMEGQLGALLKAQIDQHAEAGDRTVQIALTIARKLLPDYASRQGLSEIEGLVRQCMSELQSEPRLVIRTSDSLLDPVTAKVTALAERLGYNGHLVFLADLTLGPGDCRLEWADGGMERDQARLWSDIDRAIANATKPAPSSSEAIGQNTPKKIESGTGPSTINTES